MVTPPVDSLAPGRPGQYLRQLLAEHNIGVDPMKFLMLQAVHDLANIRRVLQDRLNEIRPIADTLTPHSLQGAPHE